MNRAGLAARKVCDCGLLLRKEHLGTARFRRTFSQSSPLAREDGKDDDMRSWESLHGGTSSSASTSKEIYTLPQDVLESRLEDLGPSLPLGIRPGNRVQDLSTSSKPLVREDSKIDFRKTGHPYRPVRRQNLSAEERKAFGELLLQILPTTSMYSDSSNLEDELSLESRLRPVFSQLKRFETSSLRRLRSELNVEELERLDQLKEVMVSFESEYELLQWSMKEVFGAVADLQAEHEAYSLFPDPKYLPMPNSSEEKSFSETIKTEAAGPTSRLYPDLLYILFVLLRDTHSSPNTALAMFALASRNPFSYVMGCTTRLYNAVLQTHWKLGDLNSVLKEIRSMRAGGIVINQETRSLVAEIGSSIQADELQAERVLSEQRKVGNVIPDLDELPFNFFSVEEVFAWREMESLVEENVEESQMKWSSRERFPDFTPKQPDSRPNPFWTGKTGSDIDAPLQSWASLAEQNRR